jgi:hypothetical protein
MFQMEHLGTIVSTIMPLKKEMTPEGGTPPGSRLSWTQGLGGVDVQHLIINKNTNLTERRFTWLALGHARSE